jgi:hypothetical protein
MRCKPSRSRTRWPREVIGDSYIPGGPPPAHGVLTYAWPLLPPFNIPWVWTLVAGGSQKFVPGDQSFQPAVTAVSRNTDKLDIFYCGKRWKRLDSGVGTGLRPGLARLVDYRNMRPNYFISPSRRLDAGLGLTPTSMQ